MLNAILGSFKNMMDDCKQKNLSGSDFDSMCEAYARMEQLGQEHSDMNAFNAQMMTENLYGKFSDFYGRALSAPSAQSSGAAAGGYDDAALLKQSVDALKQAIITIRKSYQDAIEEASGKNVQQQNQAGLDFLERNTEKGLFSATGGMEALRTETAKSMGETLKKTPNAFDNTVEVEVLSNPEALIKPIQDVIDLGEQPGMTLPRFLRTQIETGLDKAMDGAVAARDSYITEKEFIDASPVSSFHLQKIDKKIQRFDELAAANKFHVPNWTELKFNMDDIDREFERDIQQWDRVKRRWEDLLWDLSMWSLSYCSFAPYIKPWAMAKDPVAATIHTQNTGPGIFKEKEKLLQKYFGISFHDIFKQPSFLWDVKYNYIDYSQEFLDFLIEKIYPECNPFNQLPSDKIEARASFYKRDRNAEDRENNPEAHIPADRMRIFYNKKFGEGRYESKYGNIEKNDSKAAPWNIATFKYSM
ncbi:MAG: hypothetical protein CVU05_07010 [Bacteroidetes bacterium HGW-Bacteroidetes-21]|nr:MAG: hypothetical protein CVU05_07010 [Bacteroidetes bacterium HGW-Bacteroidetes-21]